MITPEITEKRIPKSEAVALLMGTPAIQAILELSGEANQPQEPGSVFAMISRATKAIDAVIDLKQDFPATTLPTLKEIIQSISTLAKAGYVSYAERLKDHSEDEQSLLGLRVLREQLGTITEADLEPQNNR